MPRPNHTTTPLVPTPSPWTVEVHEEWGTYIITEAKEAALESVAELSWKARNDIDDANAGLIAAAPDYHAAVTAMIARHDAAAQCANFDRCGCGDCVALRPITAKAEVRP